MVKITYVTLFFSPKNFELRAPLCAGAHVRAAFIGRVDLLGRCQVLGSWGAGELGSWIEGLR